MQNRRTAQFPFLNLCVSGGLGVLFAGAVLGTLSTGFYIVAGNPAPGTQTNDNQQYTEAPWGTPSPRAAVAATSAAGIPVPTPTCPPASFRVLIACADRGGPPTTLRNQILAESGVTVVDLYDASSGTPTLQELQQYNLVCAFSNDAWNDAVTMGNVLADYQDTGTGVVVVGTFAWDSRGGWNLGGRWMTGGYTPYNSTPTTMFSTDTATITQPGHPLMAGVTTLTAHYRNGVTLTPDASSVAVWTDGPPAVAYKINKAHTAVGINAYLGSQQNLFGQWGRVIVNAGRWLITPPCEATPTPTAMRTPTPTATPGCGPGWVVVNSPNPGSSYDTFNGVAAVSPNNVWAVGYATSGGPYKTLTEHWDGANWSVVFSPNVFTTNNYLRSVATVAANDVWAIGDYDGQQTLTMHWNGTDWQVVPSPNVGTQHNSLYGAAAMATNNVWAVGYAAGTGTYRTLIEHWDGNVWSVVPSPDLFIGDNYLRAVAAVSANDVWAVGDYMQLVVMASHWDGGQWQLLYAPEHYPGSRGNVLNGVAAVATNDVWAVGAYTNGFNWQMLTLHWNGTRWSVVPSPYLYQSNHYLLAVAAVAANDVWAVGYYGTSPTRTLIEHWDGSSWSVIDSPNPGIDNNELHAVGGNGSDVWAVGVADGRTLTLHWTDQCTSTPTPTPTATLTPPPTPTVTATFTPTPTPMDSPTPTPTPSGPGGTLTPTPTPTATAVLTPTPTATPRATPTPRSTPIPRPRPTPAPRP